MKKVFLSLITVFMVLSLSVVLVKASEATTVELVDGVQIRTDGNNGLKWQANIANHKEGNEYGFLFAQGELESVTVDTPAVVKKVVEGVTYEETTMQATMVKFPTDALVQDISVVAYAYDGENYAYSNVVVRNLSEVAVEAYKNGVEGDFVKEIYDASKTTFNFNGGDVCFSSYSMSDYNHFYSANGVMLHGKGRCASSGSAAWTGGYDRIFMKYDAAIDAYRVVATNADGWKHANYDTQDFDLALMNSDGATNSKFVEKLADSKDVKNYIFKVVSDVELNYSVADKNIAADITIKVYKNENDLLAAVNGFDYLGGGAALPTPTLNYYEFAGWYDNAELSGEVVAVKGTARDLYAKYTPVNYEITYNLNGGTCSETLVTSYNYESGEIILPTSSQMNISDGQFVGWYDNSLGTGLAITSIPANSYGNVELYAIWKMNEPGLVELSDYEKELIVKYAPTKFVSADFVLGKFIINDITYDVNDGALFATLDSALASAKDNDVIYLLGESHSLSVAITKKVTILGPNADLLATAERASEADILVAKEVYGNVGSAYIEFNGVTLKGSGGKAGQAGVYFQSTAAAKEFYIKSSIITAMNTAFKLQNGAGINLVVQDCKIYEIGQFFVWVTKGMQNTKLVGNIVDATTCGGVSNNAAALFRIRSGSLEAYNNVFNGDSQNDPGYFEVTGGGSGTVKYNTFKNVTKYNYADKANLITYDENLYLDAEGNVLTTVPANVSKGSAVSDTTVALSEQDRAQKYAAYLSEK